MGQFTTRRDNLHHDGTIYNQTHRWDNLQPVVLLTISTFLLLTARLSCWRAAGVEVAQGGGSCRYDFHIWRKKCEAMQRLFAPLVVSAGLCFGLVHLVLLIVGLTRICSILFSQISWFPRDTGTNQNDVVVSCSNKGNERRFPNFR